VCEKIVVPRIAHATHVHMKITAIAPMGLIMELHPSRNSAAPLT
jgi:hypothetical protein